MSLLLGEINVNIRADNSRFNEDIDEAEERARRLRRELEQGSLNLSQQLGESGNALGSHFSRVGGIMESAGRSIQNIGMNLTKYLTIPLAAAGVAVFKLGKDFETELDHIVGLVGASQAQVNEWGTEILEMAPKLGKAPKELAAALYYVTSSGIKGAAAMDTLTMSAKASAVGLGDTQVIADMVTSALNAYGSENITAAQATDILIAAVRDGKGEAADLAASLGLVLPLASEMGVSFDQVAAAVAAMTRTGSNASEATTQLKSILSGLLKPSKQAADQLDAMGTSASKMRKKIREEGLLSALSDLKDMTNKYGEEAMARVYPNIRGLMGVLDLTGESAEENAKIFENVANSTGLLEEAFKSTAETLDFKWKQALSEVQVVAISFFDILKAKMIPVLNTVITVLDFVVDKFNGLSTPIQNAILGFASVAFVLGPIILGLGTAIVMLGSTIAAVGSIISVVSSIIATVGIPVILAIVAAAYIVVDSLLVLIGTFILLWKTNEEFRTKVLDTWNSIKENGKIIFEELKKTIIYIFNSLQEFWSKHGNEISSTLGIVWGDILDIIKFSVETIKNVILLFGAVIRGDWSGIWEAIKTQLIDTLNVINETVGEKFNAIATTIVEKFTEIKNQLIIDFEEMKSNISIFLSELPNKFREGFELVKTSIVEKFTEVKESITTKLEEWKVSIIEWFTNMPTTIKELLETWKTAMIEWTTAQNEENWKQFTIWGDTIKEWFLGIPGRISEFLEVWKTSIVEWFNNTKENIKEKLSSWWESINIWFREAPGKITGFLSNWWENMKKWFEETKNKIKGKLEEWWASIKSWFNELPKKPEVRNAGQNMINKVSDGTKDKKGDFINKLGKLIVDVAGAALLFAGVALVAAGREVVKRMIKGIGEIDLKSAGQKIVQSLINGIVSKYKDVTKVVRELAVRIRDYFPFSPAKEGPLKDLDKIDFFSSINKSLMNATSKLDLPSLKLGNKIMNNLSQTPSFDRAASFGTAANAININGAMNFYGVEDVPAFMQEMRTTIKRYGGKFI